MTIYDRGGNDLVDRVRAGDFRAVARMITLIENDPSGSVPYLRRLFPHTGHCYAIGITGSPGSGKSTLVDQLAALYRGEGKRIGILAIDPTSPFTGGAILGDRIRMRSCGPDSGVFIRSMATRGQLGGLARAANDALTIFDAAGFDLALIETVGVGQDEVEIARTAQVTLVLLVPGMGDDIQAMKAGVMEIGDIFVINKSDHPGADRTEAELKSLLSMNSRKDRWRPPIVRTVASDGEGIRPCAQAIMKYRNFQSSSILQKERAIRIQRERLLELLQARLLQHLMEDEKTSVLLDSMATKISEGEIDPFSAADRILEARKLSMG